MNRVTKETYPNGDYISCTYNTSGNRATLRLPDGSTQTYSHDALTRLSSIAHSLGSQTFYFYYDTDDTLSRIAYPMDMNNYFDYDTLYRVSEIDIQDDKGDSFYTIDYSYDDNGNRTRAEWDSDKSATFRYTKIYEYDDLYQLKVERKMNQSETSRLYEYQYQFDASGNRTQMKYYDGSSTATTSYSYNDINQLTSRSIGGAIYGYNYDANGNLTFEDEGNDAREFTWNSDDRLTEVDNDFIDKEVEYTYDAMGRRIMRKDVDTNTYTMYYYDGLTVIAEKEKVGAGSWTWNRIFTVAPGVIGQILRISEKSGEYWNHEFYHYDAIGNVALKTDIYGDISEAIDQEAYGNVMVGYQSGYHLTTKEHDADAGLYYFWQRWYDNRISKFINRDPCNRLYQCYVFVKNNPLNKTDPSGLFTSGDCLMVRRRACPHLTGYTRPTRSDCNACVVLCEQAAPRSSVGGAGAFVTECQRRCKKDRDIADILSKIGEKLSPGKFNPSHPIPIVTKLSY